MSVIRLASLPDLAALSELRRELWPEIDLEENVRELTAILRGEKIGTLPLLIFVAGTEDGTLLGFIEVGLRSHADGCDKRMPVGYVEGWLVREDQRRQGIGGQLLAAAEEWARSQGCLEMASDAVIENEISQRAHKALGFEVVDRCVNYRKAL
ncbi:MAG: GNAT family N-acetyltransferase [Silvibacterium sp.]|nr:GNAT family N-acetyltransferase [Silvibacterium sp.]